MFFLGGSMATTKGKSARTVAEERTRAGAARTEQGERREAAPTKRSAARSEPVKRDRVINEAVRLVYERLREEKAPSKETVANLVQLLKVQKEIADEEGSSRREADYLWPGLEDE